MTVFEKLNSKNIDEFAKWFDNHCSHDTDPCITWWDDTYCKNCEPLMSCYEDSCREIQFSWCEIYGKCRFFPYMDNAPDSLQITKLWLESETDE